MSTTGALFALPRAVALDAFRTGCRYDVLAVKPGNVSIAHAGHGMTARDFLVSAAAAAGPATDPHAGLGASLFAAVKASVDAAGCNTNLGILLLCVPLLHAALRPQRAPALRPRLRQVLHNTSVADAAAAFAAIRTANPAGLGAAPEQDVYSAPTVPLRDAMGLAAARDSVAAQYADDFSAVFDVGMPALGAVIAAGEPLSWAVTRCYLAFLATYPDSHIARKRGGAIAAAVQARGQAVASALKACEDPRARSSILAVFDQELKNEGVNPGTSADLTVASLVAWLLDTDLRKCANGTASPRARPSGHKSQEQQT